MSAKPGDRRAEAAGVQLVRCCAELQCGLIEARNGSGLPKIANTPEARLEMRRRCWKNGAMQGNRPSQMAYVLALHGLQSVGDSCVMKGLLRPKLCATCYKLLKVPKRVPLRTGDDRVRMITALRRSPRDPWVARMFRVTCEGVAAAMREGAGSVQSHVQGAREDHDLVLRARRLLRDTSKMIADGRGDEALAVLTRIDEMLCPTAAEHYARSDVA